LRRWWWVRRVESTPPSSPEVVIVSRGNASASTSGTGAARRALGGGGAAGTEDWDSAEQSQRTAAGEGSSGRGTGGGSWRQPSSFMSDSDASDGDEDLQMAGLMAGPNRRASLPGSSRPSPAKPPAPNPSTAGATPPPKAIKPPSQAQLDKAAAREAKAQAALAAKEAKKRAREEATAAKAATKAAAKAQKKRCASPTTNQNRGVPHGDHTRTLRARSVLAERAQTH